MKIETPEIYADLKRKLITAAFQSGQKLKPASLQAEYGCAANTVRDVLLRLSMVGLVVFENQRGFRVVEVSPERLSDVARFRILLEREGATLSMTRGGVAWEARLSAAHHKLKHIEAQILLDGTLDAHMTLWSDAELEFHETLISACGSPLLRATYGDVYLQFRQQIVRREINYIPNYFGKITDEHQTILDAALARDIHACQIAISDHLQRHINGDLEPQDGLISSSM